LTAWLPDSAVFRRISRQDLPACIATQHNPSTEMARATRSVAGRSWREILLRPRSTIPRSAIRVPQSAFRIPYSVIRISSLSSVMRSYSAPRISYLDNDYGNWDRKRRGARTAMFNPHYCAALTSLREPMVVIERNSETSFIKESQSSQKLS
jgi:hypothetical protein